MVFAHFQILIFKIRTQLKVCTCGKNFKHIMYKHTASNLNISVTTAASLLSIWFVVNQMTGSSLPAAAPPTSDNNSASIWEQVHNVSQLCIGNIKCSLSLNIWLLVLLITYQPVSSNRQLNEWLKGFALSFREVSLLFYIMFIVAYLKHPINVNTLSVNPTIGNDSFFFYII